MSSMCCAPFLYFVSDVCLNYVTFLIILNKAVIFKCNNRLDLSCVTVLFYSFGPYLLNIVG